MIKKLEIVLIKCYQGFSKNFKGKCRLAPTCSNYALIALNRFGFFKGNFLTKLHYKRVTLNKFEFRGLNWMKVKLNGSNKFQPKLKGIICILTEKKKKNQ